MSVDGKPAYQFPEPSDRFINALKMGGPNSFPNIGALLTIDYVCTIGSVQLRLSVQLLVYDGSKRSYRSAMSDSREGDLNLVELQ